MTAGDPVGDPPRTGGDEGAARRPLIERVALGGIAILVAALFGGIAVAAFAGHEVFLGAMAGIGTLMTVWAAAGNIRRG